MHVLVSVDELEVDPDPVAPTLDAAFQYVVHTQLQAPFEMSGKG
jgi:hypothetical protein